MKTTLDYIVSARSDFIDQIETGAPLRWLDCARFRFLQEALDYKDAVVKRGAHARLRGPFGLRREYSPENPHGTDIGSQPRIKVPA